MFNYITVTFPGTDVPAQRVHQYAFHQKWYAHEMVNVMFRDWDPSYKGIKPGSPVRTVLAGIGGTREFIGYVHSITPNITPGKRFVSMSLIGASYTLKEARQRVFTDTTASAIVKQIASENGFSYSIEDHPRVYSQVAQAGYSDLELMSALAVKSGYSLRLENKTIYFKPLLWDYDHNRSSAQTFTMRDANNPQGSTLYSFNAILSESMMYDDSFKAAVAVNGVTAISGTPFSYTPQVPLRTTRVIGQSEFFDAFATDIVAPSQEIARYEAEAIMEMNRFPYRATAVVSGSPGLRPGMPVFLEGIGPEYSGYWLILEAEHVVVEESTNVFKYITNLLVGTDSLGVAALTGSDAYITRPPETPIRALETGVKNKYIKPEYSLVDLASAPNLATPAAGPLTANRPNYKVTKEGAPTYRIPYWISHDRDLNYTLTEKRRSSFVHERLASRNGI